MSSAQNERQIVPAVQAIERAYAQNEHLSMHMNAVHEEARRTRPTATNNAYDPKIEEFKRWCFKCGYNDHVDERKVCAFLREEVIGRQSKKPKRNSAVSSEVGEHTINQ